MANALPVNTFFVTHRVGDVKCTRLILFRLTRKPKAYGTADSSEINLLITLFVPSWIQPWAMFRLVQWSSPREIEMKLRLISRH